MHRAAKVGKQPAELICHMHELLTYAPVWSGCACAPMLPINMAALERVNMCMHSIDELVYQDVPYR